MIGRFYNPVRKALLSSVNYSAQFIFWVRWILFTQDKRLRIFPLFRVFIEINLHFP